MGFARARRALPAGRLDAENGQLIPVRVLTALAAGFAISLSLGALAIVTPSTASRVGLLPAPWAFASIAGACALTAVGLRAWRGGAVVTWLPAALLCLPWLPVTVPAAFLLWLGPFAWLVWAALAAAACWHLAHPVEWTDDSRGIDGGGTPPRRRGAARPRRRAAIAQLFAHPVRAPLLAGMIASVLYLFAGWQLSPWLPAGDEPHYLVIAESLLRDGDLRIENNHRARDSVSFGADLKPDYLRRGVDGEIYSIHAPGLPVVLLPAFAILGWPGAVGWLALLSAAGTALAWRLCWTITGRPGAAWFGWAVAALPVPVLFHAFAIFPDGLAAVLVLTGIAALVHASRLTATRALMHGAALALLPWLHTRYALLAAALGAAIVLRLISPPPHPPSPPLPLEGGEGGEGTASPAARREGTAPPAARGEGIASVTEGREGTALVAEGGRGVASHVEASRAVGPSWSSLAQLGQPARNFSRFCARRLAAFLAVPLVSAVGWFGLFMVIYGTPDPSAPYGRYTQSSLANLPAGGVGLLFDQQFGLIPNAPIYLVALGGLGWLVVRPPATVLRRLGIEMFCAIGPYVVVTAMYTMWWGGWSAPARFLVPVLPMLALPAAALVAFARTRTTRATAMVALAVSVWLSVILLAFDHGRLAYNVRDSFALWTDRANPVIDLASGLPSLFRDEWTGALARAVIWIAAMATAWLTLRVIEARLSGSSSPPSPSSSSSDAGAFTRACPRAFAVAVVPTVYAVAAMVALSAAWGLAGVSGLRPTTGQAALLRALADGRRSLGVMYGETALPRVAGASAVLLRLRIDSARRHLPHERPIFFLPLVPGGRYRLDVEPHSAPTGTLDVLVGETGLPVHTFQLQDHAASGPLDVTLPVDVSSLSVHADDRARRTIRRVSLRPLAVSAPSDTALPGVSALGAARYGPGAVYVTAPGTYLEPGGLWVGPGADVDLLIEPDRPATTLTLLVRNGPVANRVRLEVEGWRRELALAPEEALTIAVPASRRGATPLRVHAAEGFRPSQVDPANGDHRLLGVWLELR